jgi:hypothetical protein
MGREKPMITNTPEKPHFDRLMQAERDIASYKEDLKALWQSAKDALDKDALKVLKRAVKLALEDPDKAEERRELERQAQMLIEQLGPLGEAAARAGQ